VFGYYSDEEFQEMDQQLSGDQKTPHGPSAPNLSSLPPVVGRNPFLDVSIKCNIIIMNPFKESCVYFFVHVG